MLCFILSLAFCFVTETKAQKAAPTLADKRELIKIILEEAGNSPNKIIYVSTKNIPAEIQNNFPQIKDSKIVLVLKESNNSNLCPYQFGKFSVINKFVTVSFGNCNEALAYNFKKIRGRWKIVPLVITK